LAHNVRERSSRLFRQTTALHPRGRQRDFEEDWQGGAAWAWQSHLLLSADSRFSYFDLAEVQFHLELETKRKIDIGFLDSFKPYILAHVKPDLKIIYERQPS